MPFTALAVGSFVFAAAVLSASSASAQSRASNKAYCSTDGVNVVFAIDTTTPYDNRDKEQLVRGITEIVASMQGGDRLVIRTITESFVTSDHVLDQCVPRCAEDTFWGKFWSCNEGQIVSDTRKMKGEIVRSLREKLANFEEQPRSDIIRTISSLSREEMPLGRSSVLYIFSDLIENSDHMATRTLLSVSPKALINNLKKNELVASLDGAEVHAFGIGRDSSPKRNPLPPAVFQRLTMFWNSYFKASKSTSVEMSPNLIPAPVSTSSVRD
jgi:hypothetical protein